MEKTTRIDALNLVTIATTDWVNGHLVRWLRIAKGSNPTANLYLYYIGDKFDERFPGLRNEFVKVIDLPLEGRPQFNRIRMSATTDFGVDEIIYIDADADIIAPLDGIADGLRDDCTLACVESPAVHKDWMKTSRENEFDTREFNNGLLLMRDDWGERYDLAVKAVDESGASPRIAGTIAFNWMLNTNEGWGELDPSYGVIWWDVARFLGAKVVQYCNDKGQAKQMLMEEEYRASRVKREVSTEVSK